MHRVMRRPGVDIDQVSARLREVAAEIILPRHRNLGARDISEKVHGELVTIADLETEAWLSRELSALLPGSTVVGEEAAFADARVFERLAADNPVWVIDPIDGTHNFTRGSDIFAVIVALVYGSETVAGWIYEPIGEALAVGELGAGATIDASRVRLTTATAAGPYRGVAARQLFERAQRDDTVIGSVRRPNCAGHEYVELLRGERQFTAYTRLMPWDHAAGSLLTGEAGGHSALLDGSRYDVTKPVGSLLNACDNESWRRVQAVLTDDERGK
jgi:fructose-1,6-bisphosphatase/inositol monophosphatase family enzyme